jgi:hypothetical protein
MENPSGAIKNDDLTVRMFTTCSAGDPAVPIEPDAAALLDLLPKLSAKQRRQLLALARSMVE